MLCMRCFTGLCLSGWRLSDRCRRGSSWYRDLHNQGRESSSSHSSRYSSRDAGGPLQRVELAIRSGMQIDSASRVRSLLTMPALQVKLSGGPAASHL